jgi:dTDP-glucose 4,6-dehydratase
MTQARRARGNARALVTGGAGFIGHHLCERLIRDGWEVVDVIDDLSTGHYLAAGINFYSGDICNYSWGPLMSRGYDVVWHLASPASPVRYQADPLGTLRVNSVGTEKAIEIALASGARFVLASTSEVYGDPEQHPQEESYWGNVNPVGVRSCYDEGKRFAEALTMAHVRTNDLDAGIVRIFNTYGPGMDPQDGRMIPNFIAQGLGGFPITVNGDGSQTRSLCYVDDLVDGLIKMAGTTASGPINLGNPEEETVLEIAHRIRILTGSRSEICFYPAVADDPQRRRPDISAARWLLGWAPTVPLNIGLMKTVDWVANEREKASCK